MYTCQLKHHDWLKDLHMAWVCMTQWFVAPIDRSDLEYIGALPVGKLAPPKNAPMNWWSEEKGPKSKPMTLNKSGICPVCPIFVMISEFRGSAPSLMPLYLDGLLRSGESWGLPTPSMQPFHVCRMVWKSFLRGSLGVASLIGLEELCCLPEGSWLPMQTKAQYVLTILY